MLLSFGGEGQVRASVVVGLVALAAASLHVIAPGVASARVRSATVPPDDFAWPASGFVSQDAAEHQASEGQKAIDIASFARERPVLAARAGTVVTASTGGNTKCHADDSKSNGYGNYVVLEHTGPAGTLYTLYAHLSSVGVKHGQRVKLGTTLGIMGKTGCADGQHVHFAIGTCRSVSGSCTLWNAVDPTSGDAKAGTKVVVGEPTGGSYPEFVVARNPSVTTTTRGAPAQVEVCRLTAAEMSGALGFQVNRSGDSLNPCVYVSTVTNYTGTNLLISTDKVGDVSATSSRAVAESASKALAGTLEPASGYQGDAFLVVGRGDKSGVFAISTGGHTYVLTLVDGRPEPRAREALLGAANALFR
jgi:murein DD-endopeptidase MepM/ murein hydrolase activator NlpD